MRRLAAGDGQTRRRSARRIAATIAAPLLAAGSVAGAAGSAAARSADTAVEGSGSIGSIGSSGSGSSSASGGSGGSSGSSVPGSAQLAGSAMELDGLLSNPNLVGSAILNVPGSLAAALPALTTGPGPATFTFPAKPDASVQKMVSLGDSYSAMGRVFPGTWLPGPVTCVRTGDSYPVQVAQALGTPTLVDATCSGATVVDMYASQPNTFAPPQLDALSADTDLVTLSIGGNDVGLAEIVATCVVPAPLGDGQGFSFGSARGQLRELAAGAVGSVGPDSAVDRIAGGSSVSAGADDAAAEDVTDGEDAPAADGGAGGGAGTEGAAGDGTGTGTGTDGDAAGDGSGSASSAGSLDGGSTGSGGSSGSAGSGGSSGSGDSGAEGESSSGSASGSSDLLPFYPGGCQELLDGPVDERFAQLDADLDRLYADIRARAPHAQILATGYLDVLPPVGSCPALATIAPGDLEALRAFESRLDDAIAAAVERNGALTAVTTKSPGHDLCAAPSERFTDLFGLSTGAGSMHPTTGGHNHVTEEVLASLRAAGYEIR